jgi:hypothetical protein
LRKDIFKQIGSVGQSRNGSLGRATGYELESRGAIPDRKRFFFFYGVETCSAAHLAFYPMANESFFPKVKVAGE